MSVALTEICRYQVQDPCISSTNLNKQNFKWRSIAARVLFQSNCVIRSNRATALVEEIEDACFYRIGHEKLDKFRLYCRYCISPSSSCLFSSGVTHANLTMRDCKMLDLRNNKSITVEWKRKIHFMTSEVSLATW